MRNGTLRIRLRQWTSRIFVSLTLSAAILSIANVDTMLTEQDHAQDLAQARVQKAREILAEQLSERPANPKGSELRRAFMEDELGDFNPFASLANLDALNLILKRKINSYTRTTYRSPDYQGESGYDLLHYEIAHKDGSHATVLAYLELDLLTSPRSVGGPDERVPNVLIFTQNGPDFAYSHYRSGRLIEASQVVKADAEAMVAQRLNASVPFLSVSR